MRLAVISIVVSSRAAATSASAVTVTRSNSHGFASAGVKPRSRWERPLESAPALEGVVIGATLEELAAVAGLFNHSRRIGIVIQLNCDLFLPRSDERGSPSPSAFRATDLVSQKMQQ